MANVIETQRTVGDIAAENPAAASVFEKYGIDFCCGGKKPLAEACQERGASTEAVVRDLDSALTASAVLADWNKAPLGELIDHIVTTHHAYLKEELPLLQTRMEKVIAAHGARFPYLAEVARLLSGLSAELESHLMKEEMVLFPYIRSMAEGQRAASCFGTVRNPIRMMEHEHDSAGEALEQMRSLTSDYQAPEDVCNTFRALYFGLDRLERDLHTHIHLENNILFPRAVRMEQQAAA